MTNIYDIIDSLNLGEAKTDKIKINLINNHEKEGRLLLALANKNDDAKMRFLEGFLKDIPGPTKKRRIEDWESYKVSDDQYIQLPSQIVRMLNSSEFVPDPRINFAPIMNLQNGQYFTLPNFSQEPKHFAEGYLGRDLYVTNQMINMWNCLSGDSSHSIKRVLSGPMGVGKSYFALYLAARAYAEGWMLLYIADAAILDQPTMVKSSDEICKHFLALNKDILTVADLELLIENVTESNDPVTVTCVSNIFTNMLQQEKRKTLLVVDEHGVLFDIDPPTPDRLPNLVPLKRLTFWEGKKQGHYIEYIGPLTEDVFEKLLESHSFLKRVNVAQKVKKITNCVPRELIYFNGHIKSSDTYISDSNIDESLESFRENRRDEFLKCARNYVETLNAASETDYRRNLSNMFLKSSVIYNSVSFDWKFLDTGLVYRFKNEHNYVMCKPLCPAALDALLDIYRTFPIPRDVSVASLRNGQLTGDNFEEVLFQQLLNHRNIIFKATDLNGDRTTDVHIQFKHFIILEKDQLAPEPQHNQSLVRGFARYPRFDFIVGRTFIQVSVSPFDQHNRDSTDITKAFEPYCNYLKNQIEIYLDAMFGGRHTAKLENGRFDVRKNGDPVPDFRIVYMRGSSGTPKHARLVKKYKDLAFIDYDEIRDKLFGDFLRS
ncbi:hypothetical protein RclHR1_07950007 [Rhizophagus clarus]|uniref:Uncharacterized protein n=1 Tax=Rhizophagus clarus TaxID=94130 RepID=A0A2Z6SDR4_9GLOM|nr:hypothetical protein RclHR1_07950007 [Rhizophagus clarus]